MIFTILLQSVFPVTSIILFVTEGRLRKATSPRSCVSLSDEEYVFEHTKGVGFGGFCLWRCAFSKIVIIIALQLVREFLQCDGPYSGHLAKFFLQIIPQPGCENLIDTHTCLQSSHGYQLNIAAWVVELTYLHAVRDVAL